MSGDINQCSIIEVTVQSWLAKYEYGCHTVRYDAAVNTHQEFVIGPIQSVIRALAHTGVLQCCTPTSCTTCTNRTRCPFVASPIVELALLFVHTENYCFSRTPGFKPMMHRFSVETFTIISIVSFGSAFPFLSTADSHLNDLVCGVQSGALPLSSRSILGTVMA